MTTHSPRPCSAPASTGRTGRHRGSPAGKTRSTGSPVSWPGTIPSTATVRSGSSRPAPGTQVRIARSSSVGPTSMPKPALPTLRGGHVRSETGRRLATSASTLSATPETRKSETPPDRHRTTSLTITGPQRIVEDRNDMVLRLGPEVDQQVAAGDQVDARERWVAQHAVRREDTEVTHLLGHDVAAAVGGEEPGAPLG